MTQYTCASVERVTESLPLFQYRTCKLVERTEQKSNILAKAYSELREWIVKRHVNVKLWIRDGMKSHSERSPDVVYRDAVKNPESKKRWMLLPIKNIGISMTRTRYETITGHVSWLNVQNKKTTFVRRQQ